MSNKIKKFFQSIFSTQYIDQVYSKNCKNSKLTITKNNITTEYTWDENGKQTIKKYTNK